VLNRSCWRSSYWLFQAEKHCKLETARDAFGTVYEYVGDVCRASICDSFAEMAEPDIKIPLADLLQLEMRGHRPAIVGAVLQNDRTPEVGHLLEMVFPVAPDFGSKDGAQTNIRSDTAIEIAHERADECPVDQRVGQGHFRLGTISIRNGRNHGKTQSGIYATTFMFLISVPQARCLSRGRRCSIIEELFAPAQSPDPCAGSRWLSLEIAAVNQPASIDPDMTVDEIMRRLPATIRVMIRNRMLCIGCPIGIFHTVADACDAHRVELDVFSEELLEAMRADPMANAPSAFQGDAVMAT
jgi:hybrid cluster-associated redox disulfide protein